MTEKNFTWLGVMNSVVILVGFAGVILFFGREYENLNQRISQFSTNIARSEDILQRFSELEARSANLESQIMMIDEQIDRLKSIRDQIEELGVAAQDQEIAIRDIQNNLFERSAVQYLQGCAEQGRRVFLRTGSSMDICDTNESISLIERSSQSFVQTNWEQRTLIGGVVQNPSGSCSASILLYQDGEDDEGVVTRFDC